MNVDKNQAFKEFKEKDGKEINANILTNMNKIKELKENLKEL